MNPGPAPASSVEPLNSLSTSCPTVIAEPAQALAKPTPIASADTA